MADSDHKTFSGWQIAVVVYFALAIVSDIFSEFKNEYPCIFIHFHHASFLFECATSNKVYFFLSFAIYRENYFNFCYIWCNCFWWFLIIFLFVSYLFCIFPFNVLCYFVSLHDYLSSIMNNYESRNNNITWQIKHIFSCQLYSAHFYIFLITLIHFTATGNVFYTITTLKP